jgi:hypothetical protein
MENGKWKMENRKGYAVGCAGLRKWKMENGRWKTER